MVHLLELAVTFIERLENHLETIKNIPHLDENLKKMRGRRREGRRERERENLKQAPRPVQSMMAGFDLTTLRL